MKIQGQQDSLARISKIKSKSESGPKTETAGRTGAKRTVEISSMAVELSGLQEDIRNTPDIRSEKVAQIKNQIENGEYKIDEDKLAEVLVKFFR